MFVLLDSRKIMFCILGNSQLVSVCNLCLMVTSFIDMD